MPGLLDFDFDATDPDARAAQMRGLLAMGSALASTPGRFGQAFAPAAMAGVQAMDQTRQAQAARQLQAMQVQATQLQLAQAQREAQRQQQIDALGARFARSPEQMALAGGGGPTAANAARIATTAPGYDWSGFANALAPISPMESLKISQMLAKDDAPIALGEGGMLVTRSGKTLVTNPKDEKPSDIARLTAEMNKLPPGDPMRAVYMAAINKATTHPPAASTIVNATKPLMTTMGEKLGEQLDASLQGAKTATQTIATTQTLGGLLRNGALISGPGADTRVLVTQVAQALGVGGKNDAEKLANTRQAIQGLAQLELQAAEAMKGQGALTDSERVILRNAAAGQINMTAPELLRVTQALEERAYKRIQTHQANVQRLQAFPEAKPLIPFYNVEAPQRAATAPAAGGGRVVNFGDLR